MNRSAVVSASSASSDAAAEHKRSYTESGIILRNNSASRIFTDENTNSIRLVFLKADGEIDSFSRAAQSAPLGLRLRLENGCTPSDNTRASSDISSGDGSHQSTTAAASQSLTDPNTITTCTSNRTCSNELLNVLTIDDGGDVEHRISRYRL